MKKFDLGYYQIQENFINETREQALSLGLDDKTIAIVRLVNNIALNTLTELPLRVNDALDAGVSITELKEAIYQTAPYIGFARVNEALDIINWELNDKGIDSVEEDQSTVTVDTRFDKGLEVQCSIFGEENILSMRKAAPSNLKHIQDNLSANCFGDYYTRGTLDLKMREFITFTVIMTIGGADSQVNSHAAGNKSVGNSKDKLIGVVTACIPFNGYPRTLNALTAINNVYVD